MKSIGEAIQYLHSINIAHRDVKVACLYPCSARLGRHTDRLASGHDGSAAQAVVCGVYGAWDHKRSSEV